MMECSVKGCPGEYEEKLIAHVAKSQDSYVLITDVPAEVCSFCGDTLVKPETVRKIQEIMKSSRPESTVPAFKFVA